MESVEKTKPVNLYLAPLFAGGFAGISVDLTLYPLDTLKTRLQSEKGFQNAGGFRGVYKGLGTVAATSMPTTALFFVNYEATKSLVQPMVSPQYAPLVNMFSASVGEVLACLIRVPTEIAKQRKQTYVGLKKLSAITILVDAYKAEGFRNGLYRGFFSHGSKRYTIQFDRVADLGADEDYDQGTKQWRDNWISVCGSIAGGFTAAVTTPLDLAKTRIMLAEDYKTTRKLRIRPVLTTIYLESGFRGLFAGVLPRMMAFTLGGFVFFGVYDDSKRLIENFLNR